MSLVDAADSPVECRCIHAPAGSVGAPASVGEGPAMSGPAHPAGVGGHDLAPRSFQGRRLSAQALPRLRSWPSPTLLTVERALAASEPLLFPLVLSGTAARYTAEAADAETETVTTTPAIVAHEGES
jgi:hypothetical protein